MAYSKKKTKKPGYKSSNVQTSCMKGTCSNSQKKKY